MPILPKDAQLLPICLLNVNWSHFDVQEPATLKDFDESQVQVFLRALFQILNQGVELRG